MNKDFLNESLECEEIVTGQEVADILGMGEIYRQGKEMEKMHEQMKLEAQERFKDMLGRMRIVEQQNNSDIID